MSQTHLHLLITHLPIFGSVLGGLVLAHGLWTRSSQTKIAAYNLLILSAIGAVIAYMTGEAAEETIENIQGVATNMIEEHEESALVALVSLIALGIASIGGLFLTLKKSAITRTTAIVIFCLALVSFGLVARTGYLGGQIRHTEIGTGTTAVQGIENEEDED